jgi:hypothetical protein
MDLSARPRGRAVGDAGVHLAHIACLASAGRQEFPCETKKGHMSALGQFWPLARQEPNNIIELLDRPDLRHKIAHNRLDFRADGSVHPSTAATTLSQMIGGLNDQIRQDTCPKPGRCQGTSQAAS